ncbi:MAG: hypothetical protein ACP5QR_07820 [Rhizomicrobium sp.]
MSGTSDRDMNEDVARSAAKVNPPVERGALHTFAVSLVVVLSTLIVIGVGLLIYGFLRRSEPEKPAPAGVAAPQTTHTFALPDHAVIKTVGVAQNRLVLTLETGHGEEVDIFDLKDGHLVARILAPAAKP